MQVDDERRVRPSPPRRARRRPSAAPASRTIASVLLAPGSSTTVCACKPIAHASAPTTLEPRDRAGRPRGTRTSARARPTNPPTTSTMLTMPVIAGADAALLRRPQVADGIDAPARRRTTKPSTAAQRDAHVAPKIQTAGMKMMRFSSVFTCTRFVRSKSGCPVIAGACDLVLGARAADEPAP